MYYEIEGSDWLEICEETWKKFLEAFEMVQEYSYAEVANWLTYHAPQPISASQLRNVVQHRPPLMDIRYADRETREKFYKRTLESFINGYSKDSGETDEGQTES